MTGQHVPRRAVYGMVWAMGGIAVLFYTGLPFSSYMLLGGLAVLAAVLTSSWSTIYAKRNISASAHADRSERPRALYTSPKRACQPACNGQPRVTAGRCS